MAQGPPRRRDGDPMLRRAVLSKDGRVKASFEDGTWIVVEPTGSSYTYYDSASKRGLPKQNCISAFARNTHHRKLAIALDFRNAHVPRTFWCRALQRHYEETGRPGWSTQILIERAAWVVPASGLGEGNEDDSVTLKSKDGRCSASLRSGKRRFSVCYPVLYETARRWAQHGSIPSLYRVRVTDPNQTKLGSSRFPQNHKNSDDGPVYSYNLQHQHFSSEECPGEWRELLDAIARQSSAEAGAEDEILVTSLPKAESGESAEWIETSGSSFWETHAEVLYPRDAAIVLEWTPHCSFRFLYDREEAEILTHFDGGVLVSRNEGREFEHVSPNAAGGRTHRPASGHFKSRRQIVTLDKISEEATSIFSFYEKVVDYASSFLQHSTRAKRQDGHGELGRGSRANPAVSNEIFLERTDDDVGRMVAFEDRRVWIKFVDRAFLEMTHDHAFCKVFLPSGEVRAVRSHNPIGVEDYVAIAREFAAWAFQTPNERDKQIQIRSSIEAQIEASRRMAKMIDWHLGSRDPALLAA